MAYVVHHAQCTSHDVPSVTGDLFKDLVFFLVQRLPCRSSYVDKVVRNGGRVARLEAQAAMVIADPLRAREAPVGSVSYKFIDEAISEGRLPSRDQHLISAPQSIVQSSRTPSSVMTTLPRKVNATDTRTTRTPFTRADDIALYSYVTGQSEKKWLGRDIFQDYAKIDPRHTWQSYHDRFRKYLQYDTTLSAMSHTPSLDIPADNRVETTKPHDDLSVRRDASDQPIAEPQESSAASPLMAQEDVSRLTNIIDKPETTIEEQLFVPLSPDEIHGSPSTRPTPLVKEPLITALGQLEVPIPVSVRTRVPDTAAGALDATAEPRPQNNVSGDTRKRTRRDSSSSAFRAAAKKARLDDSAGLKARGYSSMKDDSSSSSSDEVDPLTADHLARHTICLESRASRNSRRGNDLPEDEQEQDQARFVKFLASVAQPQKVASNARHSANSSRVAVDEVPESDDEVIEQQPVIIQKAISGLFNQQDPETDRSEQEASSPASCELSFASHPLANDDMTNLSTRAIHSATTPVQATRSPFDVLSDVESPSSADYAEWPPAQVPDDRSDATGRINLDLPDPFDSDRRSSLSSDLPDTQELKQKELAHVMPSVEVNTQAIFDRETQLPDFTVPGAPEFDDLSDHSQTSHESLPHRTIEIEPLEEALDDEGIIIFAEAKQAEGYDLAAIQFALERTSMRALLADAVLYSTKLGKGVPQGFRGIWSDADDRDLLGVDEARIAKLDRIHKDDECEARRQWLIEYNQST